MAGMRWDRPRGGGPVSRANRVSELTSPGPQVEVVHSFDLDCGLRLGLVRVEGEVKYARYDRTGGRWRTQLSPWMSDEIDYELDRLDRARAEAEEGIEND